MPYPGNPSLQYFLEALGQAGQAVGDYMTPDFYGREAGGEKGLYSDEDWNNWYASIARPSREAEDHQRYMGMASPRLKRRLAEWLTARTLDPSVKQGVKVDADDVRQMQRRLLGLPHENTERTRDLSGLFLDWLHNGSIVGGKRPDVSVTPEQAEQWRNDPDPAKAMSADWRLTPEGQQAFGKLMDYNLLTAFADGQHKPTAMEGTVLSNVGAALGAGYEGLLRFAGGPNQQRGSDISTRQIALVNNPSPANSMRYAMEVADFAKSQDPEFFNSWIYGSAAPQMSLMTGEGLERKSESGDTQYGRATRFLTAPLMMPNRSREFRGAHVDLMNQRDRTTPIGYPDEFAAAEQLADAGKQTEVENWRQFSTYMPKWIRDMNSVIGASPQAWGGEASDTPTHTLDVSNPYAPQYIPKDKSQMEYEQWEREQAGQPAPEADPDPYAKTGITPFYPSSFVNDAAMLLPAIGGDPQNLATAAVIGPYAALTGGLRRRPLNALLQATRSVAPDIPGELGYSTAISTSVSGAPLGDYFLSPDAAVPLRTQGGRLPMPDLPEYLSALKGYEQRRTDTGNAMQQFQQSHLRRLDATRNNPAVTEPMPNFLEAGVPLLNPLRSGPITKGLLP